jgi:hypothetical protein
MVHEKTSELLEKILLVVVSHLIPFRIKIVLKTCMSIPSNNIYYKRHDQNRNKSRLHLFFVFDKV